MAATEEQINKMAGPGWMGSATAVAIPACKDVPGAGPSGDAGVGGYFGGDTGDAMESIDVSVVPAAPRLSARYGGTTGLVSKEAGPNISASSGELVVDK